MAKRFIEPNRELTRDDVLHAEDFGLVKLGIEVADFLERRVREINADDPEASTKMLCGGCIEAALISVVLAIGIKTNYGPEALAKNFELSLHETAVKLDDQSRDGEDTTENTREMIERERSFTPEQVEEQRERARFRRQLREAISEARRN